MRDIIYVSIVFGVIVCAVIFDILQRRATDILCPSCGSRRAVQRSIFSGHGREVTDEKTHVLIACEVCKKIYCRTENENGAGPWEVTKFEVSKINEI